MLGVIGVEYGCCVPTVLRFRGGAVEALVWCGWAAFEIRGVRRSCAVVDLDIGSHVEAVYVEGCWCVLA